MVVIVSGLVVVYIFWQCNIRSKTNISDGES